MNEGSARIFLVVRNVSTGIALGATLLALIAHQLNIENHLGWQVALAIIALALGIPHGAIDHLISLPTHSWKRLLLFISGYVALAVASGFVIFRWNVFGFQLVVLMSFLHFGFGDASFLAELRQNLGKKARSPSHHFLYALTSGAVPVLLPLTSEQTSTALKEIQPEIINWAGSSGTTIPTSDSGGFSANLFNPRAAMARCLRSCQPFIACLNRPTTCCLCSLFRLLACGPAHSSADIAVAHIQ